MVAKLKTVIGSTPSADVLERLRNDPAIDLVYVKELYAPQRFVSDWEGDPTFQRSAEQQAQYEQLLSEAEVLFGIPDSRPSLLRKIVPLNPQLKWVHTMAAGGGGQVRMAKLDPADLARITFTTSAGAHAKTLAEYAVFGVLCGAKELPKLQSLQREHVWGTRWATKHIDEMTICVVALGEIGRQVADYFLHMGAQVIGVNRSVREVPGVEVHGVDELAACAARSDAIINCLPGAVGTEKLISAEVLAAAKPGVIIVSLGRGSCIDEEAMIAGLQSGHIGYAALDVVAQEPLDPASPLWDLPNVLISPHTIALSAKEEDRVVDIFLENAHALIAGTPMRNLMNKELFY
ncbi:MAG: D-2-hydroxyacid dehydrogenase [Propionibacteriaceae bacterium]|jgi:phosphoglycerate dehydrogenase-like enzyme|nr:D-2-hydroxyacid dehydrogenase [Propionibacteriaceae bacterium]